MSEYPPTHIVATAGAPRAVCGERDPMPRILHTFAQAHIDGYSMQVCPECAAHYPDLRLAPAVGQLALEHRP